jgi:diguanylate cyclase (GGDEF)-like protein
MATEIPPTPSEGPAPWRPAVLWLLALLVAGAAAGLYLGVVRDLHPLVAGVHVPWWLLALGFAAAELFVIHAHVRGSAHSLSLSELPLVVGLLLADPSSLVLAQVLGPAVVLAFTRGSSPVKVVFNLAQFALTATVTICVLHVLTSPTGEIAPAVWAATFAAVGAGSLAGSALVLSAIGIAEGEAPSLEAVRMLGADLVVAVTNTSIGLAGATLLARDWHAVLLMLPPAAVLVFAYRARLSERSKHESLNLLYEVAGSLSRAPDVETALLDLLERTRSTFRVRSAEIVLVGGAGDVPLRTTLGADGRVEAMVPVDAELAGDVMAALGGRTGATTVRLADAPGALAARMALLGLTEVVIAPVDGETRPMGCMLLGERIGASGRLRAADLRLFEALAGQVGKSLEFDRLAQTMARMHELQGQLERQAYRDALTDLANRAAFMRHVTESLARPAGTSTVLFLDLDDFKPINDHWGHAAGDAVLVTAAARIRSSVRPGDLVARLGGDEFAVLLLDADEAMGEEVARRIVSLVGEAIPIAGQPARVRASVGVATAAAGSRCDADEIMRRADLAMYRAKEAGKGLVRVYGDARHPEQVDRAPTRCELLEALDLGQLIAHYQPIVKVATGEVVAAEALVRWRHPRHGLLAPAAFVPAAEATGTIPAIDRAVLEQACREAQTWSAADGFAKDAAVHVNLSGEGLRTKEIIDTVRDVLARTGLAPERLVLELTESVLIAELPTAEPVLHGLRALGVRIALDDFGTGYSSLHCLRSLPVDILKVAKPFVDGAGRTAHDQALLAMIIELGSHFGAAVVAEGIERQDQLDALADLHCDMGQGFLLGRPVDGAERRFARRTADSAVPR